MCDFIVFCLILLWVGVIFITLFITNQEMKIYMREYQKKYNECTARLEERWNENHSIL